MASKTNEVRLQWTGRKLVFTASNGTAPEITLDGDSREGPSPMDAVLLGVAACMGADVCHILGKSRVPLEALEVVAQGERMEDNPRRYKALRLIFRAQGPAPEDEPKLERAVALSRETYCSAIHSLRPDLDVDIAIERT